MKNLIVTTSFIFAAAWAAPQAFAEVGVLNDDEINTADVAAPTDEQTADLQDEQTDQMLGAEAEAVAQCHYFDRQPNRCQQTYGCVYDYRTNRCFNRGGGPGNPGRRYWICQARSRGPERHWNGHLASGWTRNQAANNAVRECRNFHGGCVVTACQLR